MSQITSEDPLSALILQIRKELSEAFAIAKAAEACAREGHPRRALQIALDIEPLVRSADHVLQAAAALQRQTKLQEN